jgi:hypothetical protein
MLEPLFSRPGRYRRYAALLASGLLTYLLGGFLLAKWLLAGEQVLPSAGTALGLLLVAVLFALMHVNSMRSLDSHSPRHQHTDKQDGAQ